MADSLSHIYIKSHDFTFTSRDLHVTFFGPRLIHLRLWKPFVSAGLLPALLIFLQHPLHLLLYTSLFFPRLFWTLPVICEQHLPA